MGLRLFALKKKKIDIVHFYLQYLCLQLFTCDRCESRLIYIDPITNFGNFVILLFGGRTDYCRKVVGYE